MKNFRVDRLAILILALLTSLTACGPAPAASVPAPTAAPKVQPSDVTRKLTVDGLERSYLLHTPPGLDSSHAVPVLFAFHGSDMAPEDMQLLTGFNEIADKNRFLVVYPAGIGEAWNVHVCCGEAAEKNVDDIAFVRQILLDLRTIVSVDPSRIYATGFSNGGAFTYRVGCEMSDVFAAIAPVSGGEVFGLCQPKQPTSLLVVHGLADPTIPYAGGGANNAPAVEQVIDAWKQLDGCTGTAQVDEPVKTVKHSAYVSCQSGTAVELYAIDQGSHDWPSEQLLPASQIIWDFFSAHPRQQ